MKATTEYVGGMKFKTEALRKYKHTITEGPLKGREFFSETLTKKKKGEWQNGETSYYWNSESPMYDTVEELIKNPINQEQ